jgi:O-methyltransferase
MKQIKTILLTQLRRVIKPHHVERMANYFAAPQQLTVGPLTYNQDGLATSHSVDFMNEQRFREAYALGKSTGSWRAAEIHWRAYVACWAADKAKTLEGDFVECGVNKGGLARSVIHYVEFPKLDKKFYLLDTFHGLAERYLTDAEKNREKAGDLTWGYEECYDLVKETFKDFNVEIIRGPVPETLPLVKTQKVSYLSLDMNCAIPEVAAAEFFWDKLVSGAVILLDDYGWANHEDQKEAFDRFASEKHVKVLPLPTGQGLIIKP